MPYPFAPAMSFNQLRERLEVEFGCQFKEEELRISKGQAIRVTYVIRPSDKRKIVVPYGDDDEMVNPGVLRSTCAKLKIDITQFDGYHLG